MTLKVKAARLNRANVLQARGDTEGAEADWEAALELEPTTGDSAAAPRRLRVNRRGCHTPAV